MNKGSILYHSRILPNAGIFEICEIKINTVTDTYFVGVDKDTKKSFLFPYSAINETVFEDRKYALERVKFAEQYMNKNISNEKDYEED